ncbi:MAG: type II toxin-antitoxin system VapC family toxin [Spirochaetaceae bacterium]|nr:MAG: type II toxin-antitoxin system VapC family toxin [Spirochaetaceae bacterium]
MRVLLDTHIALWAVTDAPHLPSSARELIVDPSNEIWVSAASVWEIAIKHALDRKTMPISGKEAVHWFSVSGYRELSIASRHTAAVEELPNIHTDPFDRLLVAQAHTEPLRLLTHDKVVAQYSELVILV